MKGYSYPPQENTARARLEGENVSWKDLAAVCANVRGLSTDDARAFLQEVLAHRACVVYSRWNKKMGHRPKGHRKGPLKGPKGRYPEKAIKVFLKVLASAEANAREKGLKPPYVILHAAACKKRILRRMAPRGPLRPNNIVLSRLEVVLRGS